jgi:hypothetical protein
MRVTVRIPDILTQVFSPLSRFASRILNSCLVVVLVASAAAQQPVLRPRDASFTAAWQALGPGSVVSPTYGNLSGRINAVAVDPNDTTGNTVYLGTTDGGVWKSSNAAASAAAVTFAPLTDALPVFSQSAGSTVVPSLAIGALAVQLGSGGVVLAGTGDPNDASDSLYGEGLLRSADGGATWTLVQVSHDGANGLHSFVGLSTAGLAWSTASPSLVVAAFTTSPLATVEGATNSSSVAGIYYSTDAGVTWQMATLYDGATEVQTAQPLGTGQVGNAATSVVWDALRGSFYAAVRGHGYYASSDGVKWVRMSAQPGAALTVANCPVGVSGNGAATCPIFRGTLAVQAATGDLYALTVDASNNDQGLWQDLCNASKGVCSDGAPVFATRIDNGALDVGSGNVAIAQGDYNLALSAAPVAANGTVLFAGTVDLYRCAMSYGATACVLRNTTNAINGCNASAAVAASQHALAAVAQTSGVPVLWLGNDGGLWRSVDGVAETGAACAATDASHFDNLNAGIGAGGSLAAVVGFAQSPTDADVLVVGLGANGSAATTAASQGLAWSQLSAGEGGLPLVDAVTPTNWYAAIGAGVNEKACAQGGNCKASDFVAPATIGGAQVNYDAALLDAPVLLDPALPAEMLTATCRVWRGPASSGGSWTGANAISAAFGGGATPCMTASPLVRSLAAGGPSTTSANAQNSGSEVMYAGLAGVLDGGTATLGGHVFVTTTANINGNTSAWKDVAASPVTNDAAHAGVFNPNGFDVSSLVVDAHDATGATVYATIAGIGASAVPHVYRSTDFGARWVTVSSNLPNAPVNALVVDPNDANTVYVATDAGVYATQGVTTCVTDSCWNLLGTGLPNAPVTSLAAAVKLPTDDGRTGMLRAGTYGRGLWQTPLLAAVSAAQPGMALSVAAMDFGQQQVATIGAVQTLTVTSSGASPLVIGSINVSGDFTETDTCAAETLAPNTTCAIKIAFAPTAMGARSGTLTVYANVAGGQATATLTGTGTAAASVVLTPGSLTFSAVTVNHTSGAQIINVANTGGAVATLQTPVVTGDFAISANTCVVALAVNTSCSVSVTFTPMASGTRNGTLSVTDSAGTQVAVLTGTGNAPATDALAPTAISFGTVVVGARSSVMQVTLTNAGDAALTLITVASGSSEFAATNGCGATLAAHASCAMSVVFVPSATGMRTGTLTVGDAFRSQTVSLTGTGQAGAGVSVTPVSLGFGASGVGLTAASQVLTLTNNGGAVLTIAGAVVSGDFVLASNTCGATLAVSQSCALTVVFTPSVAGTRVGTLTVTDNAAGGMQTVALSGMGIDFTLAANGSMSATVVATGGSATFPLLLTALNGVSASAALSCNGAPAHTMCSVTPASATIGSALNVSAVVSTGIASAAVAPSRDAPWSRAEVLFAVTMLPWLVLGVRSRRLRMRWLAAAVVGLMVALGSVGCGAGRTIPDSGGGTPVATPASPGTYTLTVSATAAGVTHSVPITLTVQ